MLRTSRRELECPVFSQHLLLLCSLSKEFKATGMHFPHLTSAPRRTVFLLSAPGNCRSKKWRNLSRCLQNTAHHSAQPHHETQFKVATENSRHHVLHLNNGYFGAIPFCFEKSSPNQFSMNPLLSIFQFPTYRDVQMVFLHRDSCDKPRLAPRHIFNNCCHTLRAVAYITGWLLGCRTSAKATAWTYLWDLQGEPLNDTLKVTWQCMHS